MKHKLPSTEEIERLSQLIKDNRLSEAYNQLRAKLIAAEPMSSHALSVTCGLIKALSLSGNFKASDELLEKSLKVCTPKDDHYYLNLSEELIEQSEFNPLSKHENSARHDKLFDQALRIRKDLVGADLPAAELIIDSIFTNLQKARQAAANALTAEAAGRLTRCRQLMSELEGLMEHLPHPPSVLVARVSTLQSFFEQSAGKKEVARNAYLRALDAFGNAQKEGVLERSDIFEMFLEQNQLYNLNTEQRVAFEKLKKAKLAARKNQTMHKIKAFPSADHIQEIMQRAAGKPGKTFFLTSLGFLGSQSLTVSVICHKDSGDMTFTIEPSTESGGRGEKLIINTVDAQEVLRHIKDLWKAMQSKPSAFGMSALAGMSTDFLLSPNQATAQQMQGGFGAAGTAQTPGSSHSGPAFTSPTSSHSGPAFTSPSSSHSGPAFTSPSSSHSGPAFTSPSSSHSGPAFTSPSSSHSGPAFNNSSPNNSFSGSAFSKSDSGSNFDSGSGSPFETRSSTSNASVSGTFSSNSSLSANQSQGSVPAMGDPNRSQSGMDSHRTQGPPMGYAAHAENRHRETLVFEGNLKTMPSLGLLQTIALNNNSGVLEVSGKDGILSIFFDGGKPVHASSLRDSGIDVLYEFVMQEEGWFRFLPEHRPSIVSIKIRLESFLLDAASLFDENKYLKSLGLTMYSGLFAKEFCSDKDEFKEMLTERGMDLENDMWDLYIALCENPIVADAVELADLTKRQWLHALYRLVQSGIVTISNEGMDDEDITARLTTKWSYNKREAEQFAAGLSDTRTGLLRFEFLIWLIEKEFERARTQMWPLSIVILEVRKNGQLPSNLAAEDRETLHTTLAQISETKRSIDWFAHFEDEYFALLMPGLDSNLAAMFASNFTDVCARNLGKLREGQSDWEYSFGIASVPGDTLEWQKMVGFAQEAQRKARVSRKGFETHSGQKAPTESTNVSGH